MGLRLYATKFQAGMTDQNSLAKAMQLQPSTVIPGIVHLFGTNYDKFGLSSITHGRGNYMMIANDEYDWNIQGKVDKPIPVVRQVSGGTATDTLGKGGEVFKLVFKEKWFALGHIICGDSRVLTRVQEHPRPVDGGFEYTLKCTTPGTWIPTTDVEAGRKWSIQFSAFEEYSKGGSSNSVAPSKLRNQLNIIRMKKEITGHTRTQVAVFEFTNPTSGKKSSYWLDWEEYLFMIQWYEQVERTRWYSEYNKTPQGIVDLPGENGRPVLMGAGMWQQMASGSSRGYGTLTTSIMQDIMIDATFNIKDADDRKFFGFSGEMGFVEMHNAILADLKSWTFVEAGGLFVTGSGQKMALGGQFITYRGLNGTEMTLKLNPIQDNPDKNTAEHPISLRPTESYRIGGLDNSTYNGKPNVLGVSRGLNGVDRSLMRWHVSGSTTPTQGAPGDFSANGRATDLDGYEINCLAQIGNFIQNPTSCFELFNNLR